MPNKNSFNALPLQIEWALVFALFFDAFCGYYSYNLVLLGHIIIFFIIINGWISSKSTHPFYTDGFLILDSIIVVVYFFMILSLNDNKGHISSKFWFFSSCLCLLYIIWNLTLKKVIERSLDIGIDAQKWKDTYYNKVIKKYLYIMGIGFLFYLGTFIVNLLEIKIIAIYMNIGGLLIWISVLSLWWIDQSKFKSIKHG